MTTFAMLFPGQGSQYVGMLSSFFCKNNNHIFKYTFDEASDYIHYNLLKLIQEGPKLILNKSQYAQIAILTASLAIYRFWNYKTNISPLFMSGHSLGEYSALVCSNAITFSDALNIVFLRGQLMQKITQNKPALMHAIVGLNQKTIQNVCKIISNQTIVSLASINSKNQIVISGDQSAVKQASLLCKKLGAHNIFKININIPAHSHLMKPISKKIKKLLNIITIKKPNIPIINNVDVKIEYTNEKIKNALIRQMYSTVRWKEIIDFIKSKNVLTMLEVGPNQILTNLYKKDQSINLLNTKNLKNFLQALKKINKK